MTLSIAYQGEPGSNSATVSGLMFPEGHQLPCVTFAEALDSVAHGKADVAMIPVDNSTAGRVADIHHLLPGSGLFIVGEYFLPIHFDLMAPPGAAVESIRTVRSHVHALGQCRKIIQKYGWETSVSDDTAGAAREVAELGDLSQAALAPPAAAALYGLDVIASAVEDEQHNTTRFLALAREPQTPPVGSGTVVTSVLFQVRNIPAALYKALGGFASNGVNLTKLESYQLDGSFQATQFYIDIDGHPDDPRVALALEELSFFSAEMRQLGAYAAHPYRTRLGGSQVLPG